MVKINTEDNTTSYFENIISLNEVIEAGQRKVQRDYRISIRDICENNNIEEGDIVIIYVKKSKIEKCKS